MKTSSKSWFWSFLSFTWASAVKVYKLFFDKPTVIKTCVFVALVGTSMYGINWLTTDIPFREGDRTGIITRFSQSYFVDSWEGDLNLGGIRTTGSSSSTDLANVWRFTVTDHAVVKKIQEAQRTGGIYTLHYKQTLNHSSWRSRTGYYVVDVFPQTK